MKIPHIAKPLGAALQHLVRASATAGRAARPCILQKGIMPLLFVLAGVPALAVVVPVIDISADNLTEGNLTAGWTNTGSLGGRFTVADGVAPVVGTVFGGSNNFKAVAFNANTLLKLVDGSGAVMDAATVAPGIIGSAADYPASNPAYTTVFWAYQSVSPDYGGEALCALGPQFKQIFNFGGGWAVEEYDSFGGFGTDWNVNAPLGLWHQIIVTNQGNIQRMYFDGVLKHTNQHDNGNFLDDYGYGAGNPVTLGGACDDHGGAMRYFKGCIAGLRIYDTAFSADDATALFTSYRPAALALPRLVSGRVTDGANGIDGALVFFKKTSPAAVNPAHTTTTDANGGYSLYVPADSGTWRISAVATGKLPSTDVAVDVATADVSAPVIILAADPTPPDPRLLVHYQFLGNGLDSSGKGRTGTLQGAAVYGSGYAGSGALDTTAAGECGFNVPMLGADSGDAPLFPAYTMTAWVKCAPRFDDWQTLYACPGFDLHEVNNNVVGSDRFVASVNRYGENETWFTATWDDVWHFVAVVYDSTAGTNGKTTFYFDEAVSTQVNGAPRTPVCFPDGARIGNWWGSRQLRGRISDFRIYGAALNAGEILAVSGAGSVTRWTITASAGAGGSITPAGDVRVVSGDSQTFTVTPGYGYRIADVAVDSVGNPAAVASGSHTFTNVTAAGHTIAATFARLPSISGVVSGPGGALFGAQVTFGTNPDGGGSTGTATTNAAGEYLIIPPDANGTYYLIASKGGHVTSSVRTLVMQGSAVTGEDFSLAKSAGLDPLVDLDASTLNVGILTSWTNTGSLACTFDSIDATHAPSVVADIGGRKAVKFDQPDYTEAFDWNASRQTLVASVPAPARITGNSDWTVSADLYMTDMAWNGSDNCYASWAGRDQGTGRTAEFDYVDNLAYNHSGADRPFTSVPEAGVWNNVTITYDGTTETVYVNGAVDSVATRALNLQPGNMMMVGGAYWQNERGEDQYWRFRNGAISRLRIFDQALSAGEVDEVIAMSGIAPADPYADWIAGPYAAWIAGFDFSSFTNPDLTPDGDPDGDGLSNKVECAYGLDPSVADDFANGITRERWENIDGNRVADLTGNRRRFLREPDECVLVPGVNESGHGVNYASRYRGFITAPVTGIYHFWIAANDEAELWFADGSIMQTPDGLPATPGNPRVALTNRYGKQVLASTRNPVPGNDFIQPLEFDKYPSQHSRPVQLQAGHEYYIEVLHKAAGGADHVSLAWQVPGGAREIIPSSAFYGDFTQADDLDDDNLPAAWETANGLNPSDNGRFNARDGQYGDWDGDGLTNLEEYQLGTNPKLADTDGDGLSDKLERDYYHTDPTVSNIITAATYATLAPHNYASATGYWNRDDSGSLTALDRRGEITYNFTVAPGDAGVFEIVLTGGAAGIPRPVENLTLVFSINGNRIGATTLTSLNGASATTSLLTPWLKAGDYALTILHDNYRTALQLRIDSLLIRSLSGLDANGNQLPDWIEQRLAAENRLTRVPATSLTSPLCIEGVTTEGVAKEGANRRIPGLSLKVNGEHLAPNPSVDSSFYADVPLSETGPVTLTASFQSGALGESRSITWLPANLRGYNHLHIRKGDALRLDAWNNAGNPDATKTFTVTLDGTLLADAQSRTTHTSGQPFSVTFDTAGTHTLVTTFGNKPPHTTTLHVHRANFGPALSVRAYYPRDWTPPAINRNLVVETDSRLSWQETTVPDAPRSFRVTTFEAGERHVLARIPGDVEGAPSAIVDRGTVNGFYLAYIDQTGDARLIHTYPDGTRLMSGSIVAVGLPPDVYIRLKSFYQGTLFTNGSDTLWLTAANFDRNGIATIYFEWDGEGNPSMCTYVDLFTTTPPPPGN